MQNVRPPGRLILSKAESTTVIKVFSLFFDFRHGVNFKISLKFMEGYAFEEKVYIVL